jgi:hypothetical protein
MSSIILMWNFIPSSFVFSSVTLMSQITEKLCIKFITDGIHALSLFEKFIFYVIRMSLLEIITLETLVYNGLFVRN